MKLKSFKLHKTFFFVFGLPFFIAGLMIAYFTFGKMTVTYFSSFGWQQVPATILSLKKYDRTGSLRVTGKYAYYFQDVKYESENVTLINFSSDLRSYGEAIYKQIKQDEYNGELQAWVNTDNPSEALLNRTFNWFAFLFGFVLLTVLGGTGLLCIWGAIEKIESEDAFNKTSANDISSSEKSYYRFIFVLGSFFSIVGFLAFMSALPSISNKGQYAGLLTLLFLVCGIWLLISAYKARRRYKLTGPTQLFLNPFPGVIDGHIGGEFEINARSKNTQITIVLSCKERVAKLRNDEYETVLLWQESVQAYVEPIKTGMKVRFLFNCPEGLPSSDVSSVSWNVCAKGSVLVEGEMVKFNRTWDRIPVTNDLEKPSSIDIPLSFLKQQNIQKLETAKDEASGLVNFNQYGQILEIENFSKRPIFDGALGFLGGLVFIGLGVYMISEVSWAGCIPVFIGSFSIYSFILSMGRSINVKIDLSTKTLFVQRNRLGFVLYKREIKLFQPSQLFIEVTSTVNSGNGIAIDYCNIQILSQGSLIIVLDNIKGLAVAEAVMNDIVKRVFPEKI